MERDYHASLLHAVELVNRRQVERTVVKLERELGALQGRIVAVLGLAFKPNTDDVRNSPAVAIIQRLIDRGAGIRAHNPIANDAAAAVLGSETVFCVDIYDAVADVDAILIATEWNEFRTLDFGRCATAMRGNVIIDGRNIFDAQKVHAAGLRYLGVGRVTPRRPGAGAAVYENEVTQRAVPK